MVLFTVIAWLALGLLLALMIHKARQNRHLNKARANAWHRQRWSIQQFNGRHRLDFGYYLHRSQ